MADEPNPAPEPTDPNAAPTSPTSSADPKPADPAPAPGDDPKPSDQAPADPKPADEPTALGKKADEPPAIIGAPDGDYEIKAPEGREFDKEAFEVVAPVLKGLNLSNEAAQQIVSTYAEKVLPLLEKRAAEQQQLATAAYRKQWLDEAKADPEIGGAKWDESLAIAGKVFDAVGIKQAEPFRQLLEESGLGSHPDAIRFMRRMGSLIGEDKFVRGDGDSSTDNRPVWDRVYGGPTTETARA